MKLVQSRWYQKRGERAVNSIAKMSESIHLTTAERLAAGKKLREKVPRSSHANWQVPQNRPDTIELLKESDRGRLPALLPIRYTGMRQSHFAFLRVGHHRESDEFNPAVRIAYNYSPKWTFAAEHYAGYGPLHQFEAVDNQYHTMWAVVDHAGKALDVEAGIGFGVTSGSDKVTLKLMLSRDIRKPREPADTAPNRQGGSGNP